MIFSSHATVSRYHRFSIIKPGIINIDGNEFNFSPNFKTLYQTYRDGIHDNVALPNKNVLVQTENNIWDWINDRGDVELHPYAYPSNI